MSRLRLTVDTGHLPRPPTDRQLRQAAERAYFAGDFDTAARLATQIADRAAERGDSAGMLRWQDRARVASERAEDSRRVDSPSAPRSVASAGDGTALATTHLPPVSGQAPRRGQVDEGAHSPASQAVDPPAEGNSSAPAEGLPPEREET